MLGIQETEKIFSLENQQQQELEYLIGRDPTGFGNIGFSEKPARSEVLSLHQKTDFGSVHFGSFGIS